jgi:hypothetical protein
MGQKKAKSTSQYQARKARKKSAERPVPPTTSLPEEDISISEQLLNQNWNSNPFPAATEMRDIASVAKSKAEVWYQLVTEDGEPYKG